MLSAQPHRIDAILWRSVFVANSKSLCGLILMLAVPAATAMAQQAAQTAMPKKASEAFKNVKVMGDIPADQWFDTMSYFDDALGVNCDHCHKNPFEADAKPESDAVLALARKHRLTVYDAAYLELAQRRGLPLATPNAPLAAAAQAEGVKLIGDGS